MPATWKKILLEGDSIPASSVTAGAFGSGSYDIDGSLTVDTINEHTSANGVDIQGVHMKNYMVLAFSAEFGDTRSAAASQGVIRLQCEDWIAARNYGNTADVNMIRVNSSNVVELGADVKAAAKFGCNGANPQAAYASGGALAAYAAGTAGLDSGAHMSALHALVVNMRAALVANGTMS